MIIHAHLNDIASVRESPNVRSKQKKCCKKETNFSMNHVSNITTECDSHYDVDTHTHVTQFNTILDLHMPFQFSLWLYCNKNFLIVYLDMLMTNDLRKKHMSKFICKIERKTIVVKKTKHNSYVRRNVNVQQISVVVNEKSKLRQINFLI